MSNPQPEGLGFEGWMQRLREGFSAAREQPRFDPGQRLDDLGKMRALMAIDQRYLLAMADARPGRVNRDVLRDIDQIAQDYRLLLSIGPPNYPFYTEQSIREKIADTLDLAARTAGTLRDQAAASQYYIEATAAYEAAGNREKAQRCQTELSRIQAVSSGKIDAEIRLLHKELSKAPRNSLAAARARIDLGMLYGNNGDDTGALELLGQAEEILEKISPDPTGTDLASAFTETLADIAQESHREGPTAIERKMEANNLYRALYTAYARIFATTHPVKAAEYRAKVAKRDSRQSNDEFSQAMLRSLPGNLGKL